jgi:carbon monoxide dehydrogenase subunit G
MNYTTTIDLNVPIDRVVSLFDDPENMKKWQPELLSFEHISGDAGQPGAKSRLNTKWVNAK